MFDSVIRPAQFRQSRWGSGFVVAVAAHAASLALAVYLSKRPAEPTRQEVDVKFVKAPPPPPPPPPPAPPKTKPVEKKPIPRRPDAIIQPKEMPKEKPPEAEPQDEDTGVEGGVDGGVVGGVVGGVIGGPPPPKIVEFNDTMTPPKKVSGPDPEYNQKALDHEVEGQMVVKCVVTVQGVVHNCRVLKSVAFMDRAVIEALERRRYTPAMLQGKPIDVDYTFRITLTLPR